MIQVFKCSSLSAWDEHLSTNFWCFCQYHCCMVINIQKYSESTVFKCWTPASILITNSNSNYLYINSILLIGIIKLSPWSLLGTAKIELKLFADTVWKWEVPFGNLVPNLNWSHWSVEWLQKCKIAKLQKSTSSTLYSSASHLIRAWEQNVDKQVHFIKELLRLNETATITLDGS